jgi:zinc transporter ZupT
LKETLDNQNSKLLKKKPVLMSLGIGVGIALGAAMHNIGIGLIIGIAIGSLGVLITNSKKLKQKIERSN